MQRLLAQALKQNTSHLLKQGSVIVAENVAATGLMTVSHES